MPEFNDPLDGIHAELAALRRDINTVIDQLKKEAARWEPRPAFQPPPKKGI